MQIPAAFTFVLDGALMGANDFHNLRWQTTLAFAGRIAVLRRGTDLAVPRVAGRVVRDVRLDQRRAARTCPRTDPGV